MVLTTIACLSLFVGLIVKWFVTPEWIDKQLKLTEHVQSKIVKEVDSGYSTIVIFRHGNVSGDNSLDFYSEPDQKVELYVSSDASGFPPNVIPEVTIQLNGDAIKFRENEFNNHLPNTKTPKDLSGHLKKQEDNGKLQTLTISSQNALDYKDATLVIKALILVSNKSQQDQKSQPN